MRAKGTFTASVSPFQFTAGRRGGKGETRLARISHTSLHVRKRRTIT